MLSKVVVKPKWYRGWIDVGEILLDVFGIGMEMVMGSGSTKKERGADSYIFVRTISELKVTSLSRIITVSPCRNHSYSASTMNIKP